VLLTASGCSIRRMAINRLGEALASSGDVFTSDDDPELIRDALPFALKTTEALLQQAPENTNLLLAACSGYAQYAYAFVKTDADLIEHTDYYRAVELRERALRLFLRARGYGLEGLELEHPGITERLQLQPETAVEILGEQDLPLLFWTAAAWGSAISLGKDRPELIVDLPAVQALIGRGLELDEGWNRGSLHEAAIVLEALPAAMGGSEEKARQHFERAVELSGGLTAGPYVTLAQSVSVQAQDREEFERLLNQALEIDPDRAPSQRLVNVIAQRSARHLLEHVDDLFLDSPEDEVLP
jgi:predicted anti-sigma-YlaC factor YlaD